MKKTVSWQIVVLTMLGAVAGRASIVSAVSSDPADSSLTISGKAVNYVLDFPSLTPIMLTVDISAAGSYGLNAVVSDNIKNSSGAPWTTFDVHLSSSPSGSSFNAVGYNTSDFPSLTRYPSVNPTDVYLSGGDIANGSGFTLQLGITATGPGSFVAAFTPNGTLPNSTPEPGTLSLLLIGAVAVWSRRARFRPNPDPSE